jgi:hypothetical protein
VIVLSAYAFRESQLAVPMARGGRNGMPLQFGMFAAPLSSPGRDLNRALAEAYLAAAGSYLNAEAVALEQRGDPDAIHVAICYFLVKKLRGYAERKYAEAEQRIADIRDEKFRDPLDDYLHLHTAEASIRKRDWNSFNAQVNPVSDARLRTYLLLSAARAAGDARKKEMPPNCGRRHISLPAASFSKNI